jgi:hypothetical protein
MKPTGPNLAGNFRQTRPATERRHSMRHRAYSPAYARLNAPDAEATDLSEILDISEQGMSIQTSSPLPVERTLSVSLELSETNTSIRTTGQVVWSESSGRAGIRFARLSRESLHQLKEWLFVNVLTAFDHAGAILDYEDENDWKSASKGLPPSHTMPKEDFISGTSLISRNGDDGTEPYAFTSAGPARGRATERESEGEPKLSDRETTLPSMAERALTLTRATGAAIALSQGRENEMTCVASAGDDAPPVGCRLQVGSGFSGECVRSGRSLRCDDSETDERVDRASCKSLGIRSVVAVPIRQGSKVIGLLEVFSPQPYAFNADDIGALQQLAGNVVATISSLSQVHAEPSLAGILDPEPQIVSATPAAPPPVRSAPLEKQAAPAAVVDTERPAPATRPVSEFSLPHSSSVPSRSVPVSSSQPSLAKALFVAAIGTFVFALLWLIAPWVSKTFRSSGQAPSRAHAQAPPAGISKSPSLPPSVSDLASLRKVAEQGDPAAQFSLGARYATGEDVQQDYTEAVRWFTMAAEQGHILAQATLGAYYWAGRGVPQDLTKAYYWSVLAQAGGDQASKYRVAVLASRMSRSQVLAAQQQANKWLSNFASHPPANP